MKSTTFFFFASGQYQLSEKNLHDTKEDGAHIDLNKYNLSGNFIWQNYSL